MVAKLSKALRGEKRRISLGYGVSFEFEPFTFAQYKEAEAWAMRNAREGLTSAQEAALAGAEVEELGGEFQDTLMGLAAQMILDRLVMNFCTGWDGVEGFDKDPEDSAPLAFTPENWEMFRDEMPALVELLEQQLRNPMHIVVTEGNGSGLSQST